MYNFAVHSNEIMCRKGWRLGLDHVKSVYFTLSGQQTHKVMEKQNYGCLWWMTQQDIFRDVFEEDVLYRETSSTLYSAFEVLDTIGYDAKFVVSDDSSES